MYIGTPTEVRMSSMFPTLHEGERLWLSRLGRTTKKHKKHVSRERKASRDIRKADNYNGAKIYYHPYDQ